MKRLQVLFLVALSSSLLLFGCGKEEEETVTQPIVEPIVEAQPEKEEEPAAPTTKVCPFCKSEIDIEATRCPHCTSEIRE